MGVCGADDDDDDEELDIRRLMNDGGTHMGIDTDCSLCSPLAGADDTRAEPVGVDVKSVLLLLVVVVVVVVVWPKLWLMSAATAQ